MNDKSNYELPIKRILKEDDMIEWKQTEAYRDLDSFLKFINKQAEGKHIVDLDIVKNDSENVKNMVSMLQQMEGWIDNIKLVESGSRFGNLAFREWHEKLEKESNRLIENLLPKDLLAAKIELIEYLKNSFGNSVRIDYGSGHELHFFIFLLCLTKIEFFNQQDCEHVILIVFNKYLGLVRKLQLTYSLEPAGSHGVWGLDDFQFLPYIFGSSQLIPEQDIIQPKNILDPKIMQEYKHKNLFFGAVDFIHKVKTGPFHEHSPMLHQISQVPLWFKVNNGLIRMFNDEVLSKFPIMQHCLFGSLFKFVNIGSNLK